MRRKCNEAPLTLRSVESLIWLPVIVLLCFTLVNQINSTADPSLHVPSVFAMIFFISSDCGVSSVMRVIGGVDAKPGSWPWQVRRVKREDISWEFLGRFLEMRKFYQKQIYKVYIKSRE